MNNVTAAWADLVAGGFFAEFTYEARRRYQKSLAALALSPSAWIVEIGCGTGRYNNLLAEVGYRNVMSCDLTLEHLRRAREVNPSGLFVVASGEKLPFRDGVFDGLVTNAAIEHFANPQIGVAEFARVTTPEARLVVTSDCYSWRIMQVLGLYTSKMPIDKALTYAQFRRLFEAAGLEIAAADAWGITHYLRKLSRLSPYFERWLDLALRDEHWSNQPARSALGLRARMVVLDENMFVLRRRGRIHESAAPAATRTGMRYEDVLVCPECRGELVFSLAQMECSACGNTYFFKDGIPIFL